MISQADEITSFSSLTSLRDNHDFCARYGADRALHDNNNFSRTRFSSPPQTPAASVTTATTSTLTTCPRSYTITTSHRQTKDNKNLIISTYHQLCFLKKKFIFQRLEFEGTLFSPG